MPANCTVTVHVAVLLPSTVLTVIIACPAASGVTTPFATVATVSLFDAHVTSLFVASAGNTVAVSVSAAPPAVNVKVSGSTVTSVTAHTASLTVTVAVPDFVLSPFEVAFTVNAVAFSSAATASVPLSEIVVPEDVLPSTDQVTVLL